MICSFLPFLSWLLRSRVRKFRRDLWITLYIPNISQLLKFLHVKPESGRFTTTVVSSPRLQIGQLNPVLIASTYFSKNTLNISEVFCRGSSHFLMAFLTRITYAFFVLPLCCSCGLHLLRFSLRGLSSGNVFSVILNEECIPLSLLRPKPELLTSLCFNLQFFPT